MFTDPIPFFSPSATHREIERAAGAAGLAWNERAGDYVRALELLAAHHAKRKYAFAVSDPVSAVRLALSALGVFSGDEVLLPDTAPITLAAAVAHMGATPVFCDVEPRTFRLSPASLAARITPKSKVIIPVHMHGQLCDMEAITRIAEQNRLLVLEDASLGLGGTQGGLPAGYFGHIALFNFHEDCGTIAGRGGVLVFSDDTVLDRVRRLGGDGRSGENPFIYDLPGFDCAMGDRQASFMRAQWERLTELTEKKRRIFHWYKERLEGFPGLRLNPELPGFENGFVTPFAEFEDRGMLRHELLRRMAASGVECRPLFYPLSSMRMFTRADNPVAYGNALRVVLLPGGYNMTEDEADYAASALKELYADKSLPAARVKPAGAAAFKKQLLETVAAAKTSGLDLPFLHNEKQYVLQAITAESAADPEVVRLIYSLQQNNLHAFFTRVPSSEEGAANGMRNYATNAPQHLLFLIADENEAFGFAGLDNFDFVEKSCCFESLFMRRDAPKGLAGAASDLLLEWLKSSFGLKKVYNITAGSNIPVRLLISSQGFKEINKIPQTKEDLPDGVRFRPLIIPGTTPADEYLVTSMKIL